MEEFIENFTKFRDWLNNLDAKSQEELILINNIRSKLNELNLNNCF